MIRKFSSYSMKKAWDQSLRRIERVRSVVIPIHNFTGDEKILFEVCIIGEEMRILEQKYGNGILDLESRFQNSLLHQLSVLKGVSRGIKELYDGAGDLPSSDPLSVFAESLLRNFAKQHGIKIWGSLLFH